MAALLHVHGSSFRVQLTGSHLNSWKPRPILTSSLNATSFGPSVGSGKSSLARSCNFSPFEFQNAIPSTTMCCLIFLSRCLNALIP